MQHAAATAFAAPGPLGLFRRWAAGIAWMVLGALAPLLTGCQSYYRAKESEVTRPNVNLLAESKRFLVHQGSTIWELQSPRLNGEMLEGTKQEVSAPLTRYKTLPAKSKTGLLQKKKTAQVLNIVHVYISDLQPGTGDQVSIPFSGIRQIDLVEEDTNKTTVSYVLGGLGMAVGVAAILLVIVALTKSSCPFVYAYDGQGYHFVGEAYGGAIFAPAERNDYLPLPAIEPENNQYKLKISNELKERQYTNVAELWVAEHPAGAQVLLDSRGRPHTLQAPQAPTQARTPSGHDYTAQLQATDRNPVLFNDAASGNAPNELTMTFAKPAAARHGKLVLHAQNSLWLDYLYGEFIKKFGSYYNTWADQQRTQPAAINRQWGLDQGIPLQVYVDAGQGWRLAESINTVGPLASRDLVVPLDFAANATAQVRVKLACGFMFWEVDYAALDCSPNAPVQLDHCRLQSALTERGQDARAQLAADDAQYLRQLRPGTAVSLVYETGLPAPKAGTRRTAFLRTKGYYEHIREFEGLPNLPELYAFKKPGRFIEFSKEKYRATIQDMAPAVAQR